MLVSSSMRAASLRLPSRAQTSHRRVAVARSSVDDTPGVQSLLARDRKKPKVQPELLTPADAAASESFLDDVRELEQRTTSSSAASTSSTSEVIKTKKQRREDMAKAATGSADASSGPRKCKEAMDRGLELFGQQQYQQAIAMFNLALELPGNAAYRLPGSPREYSCPSDAEENAALYNMACCYVALGQRDAALTCLEAVLESGTFRDFSTMRGDRDLAPLGRALQDLVNKYDNPLAQVQKGVLGSLLGAGKKELVSDERGRKPWILW